MPEEFFFFVLRALSRFLPLLIHTPPRQPLGKGHSPFPRPHPPEASKPAYTEARSQKPESDRDTTTRNPMTVAEVSGTYLPRTAQRAILDCGPRNRHAPRAALRLPVIPPILAPVGIGLIQAGRPLPDVAAQVVDPLGVAPSGTRRPGWAAARGPPRYWPGPDPSGCPRDKPSPGPSARRAPFGLGGQAHLRAARRPWGSLALRAPGSVLTSQPQ